MGGLRYILARRRLRELLAAEVVAFVATMVMAMAAIGAPRTPMDATEPELGVRFYPMIAWFGGLGLGWPILKRFFRHLLHASAISNLALLAAVAGLGLMGSDPTGGCMLGWLVVAAAAGVGIARVVADRYRRLAPKRLLASVRATELGGAAVLAGVGLLVLGIWAGPAWARRWDEIRYWTLAASAALFALLWLVTTVVRYRRAPISPGRWFLFNVIHLYAHGWHGMRVRGRCGLPRTGGAVMAATHVSAIDPVLLQSSCRRLLRWVIAREYYEIRAMGWLYRLSGCIPVNRSKPEIGSTRAALRLLDAGEVVGIFPYAGIRPSADTEMPFKAGAVSLALRARVPLAPVRIVNLTHRGMVVDCLRPHRGVVVEWLDPIPLDDLYDQPDRSGAIEEAGRRLAQVLNAPADSSGA